MKLRPGIGKLFVECESGEEVTKSGIILPDKDVRFKRFLKGIVLEASKYKYLWKDKEHKVVIGKISIEVKKGDKILFEEARARDFLDPKEPTKKYYLLDENLVYAVLEEE